MLKSCQIPQILRQRQARAPDGAALGNGDLTLSNSGLLQETTRIAVFLRKQALPPGTRIALLGEKQFSMIAAYLACLGEGLCVVPIDANYPSAWITDCLDGLDVRIGLTAHPRIRPGGGGVKRTWIALDDIPATSWQWDVGRPRGANEAALIYRTSGSTGRPKFIEITHGNLAASFETIGEMLGSRREDVVANTASISFSSSIRQMLYPVLHDATTILVERALLGDPADLFEHLARRGTTTLELLPSLLTTYARSAERDPAIVAAARGVPLRHLSVASEPLTFAHVRRWRSVFPDWPILHLYGTTETTGIVACKRLDEVPATANGLVPIGRAVGENRLETRPTESGDLELLVTSAQVARNLEGGSGGDVLATGDLVEWLRDGELRWISRADHQGKIRGVRYSGEEVAALLSTHPAIAEVAVVALAEQQTGRARLAAVYVKDSAAELDAVTLDRFAASLLPESLVPSTWIALSALPRRPNLKLDMQALNALAANHTVQPPGAGAPAASCGEWSAIATEIAEIWRFRLQADSLDLDSRFQEMGGDSLTGLLVIADIKRELGVSLRLNALKGNPSLAMFARLVEAESPRQRSPA